MINYEYEVIKDGLCNNKYFCNYRGKDIKTIPFLEIFFIFCIKIFYNKAEKPYYIACFQGFSNFYIFIKKTFKD